MVMGRSGDTVNTGVMVSFRYGVVDSISGVGVSDMKMSDGAALIQPTYLIGLGFLVRRGFSYIGVLK